jgi:phosphoserine phosphatase RsbU/P
MLMRTLEAESAVAPAKSFRVLICDDQSDVLEALRLLLKGLGYQAVTVDSPAALLRAAREDSFDLIVADLNYTRDTTSGAEGLDLLASLEAQGNATPVVVMTAWGSVDLAVEAMRHGACDFIQKPWDNARVISVIRKQAESERQRKSELEIAANVQQKLFPHAAEKRMATVEYAGRCLPARTVGGDYFDFLEIASDKMGFILGDVSGKGVPAALLMANLQACFRSHEPTSLLRPAYVLEMINRHFFESTAPERFATLFFGVYDDETRALRYVNCGQVPPLLMRRSGELERLAPTATMLGAFRHWNCVEEETVLERDDVLLLYSDGVTEACGESDEEFGEERLSRWLSERRGLPVRQLVDTMVDEIALFSRGERHDDVTVVAVRGL